MRGQAPIEGQLLFEGRPSELGPGFCLCLGQAGNGLGPETLGSSRLTRPRVFPAIIVRHFRPSPRDRGRIVGEND